jgi:hypothetical protein
VLEQDPTLREKERMAYKKVKSDALNEIKGHNPNIEKLISNIGLEISEDFSTFPPTKASEDFPFVPTEVPF